MSKNYEVDEDNWKEKQKELDATYDKIPKEHKDNVSRIVELEIELTNVEE